MRVHATARNIRVSARKARLLLDELPGKGIDEASTVLRYSGKPIAKVVDKVLQSAAANAENNYSMDRDALRVVEAYAGEGPTLKRYKPRSRGRVSPILKRTAHITVIVDEAEA
ncbi:MAG TPA: 50S ribosomal protein L22 [Dehalococcoidia bacterium]|nr:50S ribosomal protein L22 [Dehalococcoidia bacterium]